MRTTFAENGVSLHALRPRLAAIDGLRALLALWVVLAHLIPWTIYVQGPGAVPAVLGATLQGLGRALQPTSSTHPAVVCFIVLSGYCIHASEARRRLVPASYAVRRFFRIYPVFAAAAIFAVIVFVSMPPGYDVKVQAMSGTASVGAATFAARLIGLSAWVPSLNRATYGGNSNLHTVMVEIWLYAAYPVLVPLFDGRMRRRLFAGALAALWLAGAAFEGTSPDLRAWWNIGSVLGFLPYWWLGTIAVYPRGAALARRLSLAALPTFLVLTSLAASGRVTAPSVAELQKLCLAVLFLVVIDFAARGLPSALARLAPIGVAGYSLYAFHAPMIYLGLLAGWPWWLILACIIPCCLAISALFERPIDRLGHRIAAGLAAREGTPTRSEAGVSLNSGRSRLS